jgi:hypothetical protein
VAEPEFCPEELDEEVVEVEVLIAFTTGATRVSAAAVLAEMVGIWAITAAAVVSAAVVVSTDEVGT